jgi:diguanylate cyclase (GGDEF)-like protein
VQGQSYFQLISPLIFLVFSSGFAIMWLYARDLRSIGLFAISYLFGACALFADFMRPAIPPDVAIYLINTLFMITTGVFAAAVHDFYGSRTPFRQIGMIMAATALGLGWYRYGVDNIAWRTVVANIGAGAMFLLPAVLLHSRMRRIVDRFLLALLVINAVHLFARAGFIYVYDGAGLTTENYSGSTIGTTLHFSAAITALSLATVLFFMYGMAIVARLTHSASTDPLTGLLNRRGFDARLDRLMEELATGGTSHGFIIADIDDFKSVNDVFGHETGDAVIASFARILAGTARPQDVVARWGGEEFVIVLVDSDAPTAKLFAEAVKTVFSQFDHCGLAGKRVTASFGVGAWRQGDKLRDIYIRTDEALYAAKQSGRNRVRMASGSVFPLQSARTAA